MSGRCFTFSAHGPLYGLSWSCRADMPMRLAVSTISDAFPNEFSVISLQKEKRDFRVIASASVVYPLSKIQFLPSKDVSNPDLIATVSDSLRIFEIDHLNDDGRAELCSRGRLLVNETRPVPILSMDWCAHSLNIIMTANLDTTVSLWDIYKQEVDIRFVAQERAVTDCCFSLKDPNRFLTCGAEGNLRLYDRRRMHVANEVYAGNEAILRAQFKPTDSNFITCVGEKSTDIILLDARSTVKPLARLKGHTDYINGISWGRDSHGGYFVSVANDGRALIWDGGSGTYTPFMEYVATSASGEPLGPINSVDWNQSNHDWVALTVDDEVQILHV